MYLTRLQSFSHLSNSRISELKAYKYLQELEKHQIFFKKMPLQKIPVTMRDFFWDDPFFSNVWEDFDSLRNSIWKESSDKFSRFEREHRSSINDSDFKSTSLTCKYNSNL